VIHSGLATVSFRLHVRDDIWFEKTVVGVDSGRTKMYNFDWAMQVKAAFTDMPTAERYRTATKVSIRGSRFASEDENLAEGV
jgi:hypothetical protein